MVVRAKIYWAQSRGCDPGWLPFHDALYLSVKIGLN